MNKEIKILLVDDVKANLLSISNLLESDDYDIYTAESGNQALSMMLDHQFALVLLDVMMPEMDGFEVAEIMKGRECTQQIPIIFMTAMDNDDDFIFRGYKTGAIDILFKPVNPEVLKGKVRVFCELHRQKELLNTSLADKEFLMKEIHHRIKNNLIMINSFINLQKTSLRTEGELDLLSEVESRITIIMLIHEKLYTDGNYQDVDIRDYLSEISKNLLEKFNSNRKIELALDIQDLRIHVDTAISLGLLLTEMMTNTIKYAFPNDSPGQITVTLKNSDCAEEFIFTYGDDGIGIMEEKIKSNNNSLGITLIKGISQQLRGDLEIDLQSGLKYKLVFAI